MEFDGQIKHSECRSTADSVFFSVFLFLSGVCFFFNFFTSSFFFFFDSSKKTSPITKDERLSLQPSFFCLCLGQGAAAQALESFYRGLVHSGKTNLPV